MIEYLDLLGRPYAELPCGAVSVAVAQRAGYPVPIGALERPEDFARWVPVAQWGAYADGDVILGRTLEGVLFAAGVVDGRAGLALSSHHAHGVFAIWTRDIQVEGVYRWA